MQILRLRGHPDRIHTLHLEKVDQKNYRIQSRERDPLIARWDHLVSIKPLDSNHSVYRDTIDIDAGRLTFAVWAVGQFVLSTPPTPLASARKSLVTVSGA
jgi:hypothetical protein